jgi:hypothetical protein
MSVSEHPIFLCLQCKVKYECGDNAEELHDWIHEHYKHSIIIDYNLDYYNIKYEDDESWQ